MRGGRRPLDRTVVVAQFLGMITRPRAPQFFEHKYPRRLVVKARTPIGPTSGFVWEIISDGPERQLIGRSSVSYSSMAEAYEHGAIAIKRVGSKAQ
jgi:hypothetical protein